MQSFIIVIEPNEDEFHAFAPSLPGCHTFGATIDEALHYIKEAIDLYIKGLIENGLPTSPR